MSFDIFFQPLRYGTEIVEFENPFSGEISRGPRSEPLTASELHAVRSVLCRADARAHDEPGCYTVEFDDGGDAEVFGGDNLATGCMVSVRGIIPDLLQFLMELMKAGNWGMIPVMEPAVAIAASLANAEMLRSDFPEVVVCESAEDLGRLLTSGFNAWKKYRDQVIGGGD